MHADLLNAHIPLRGYLCVYCNVGGIGIDETVLFVLAWGVVIAVNDARSSKAR